jgi:alcohol dehydrogenase class IV
VNSFLLPYVMDFNKTACLDKYSRIAAAMGVDDSNDIEENNRLLV